MNHRRRQFFHALLASTLIVISCDLSTLAPSQPLVPTTIPVGTIVAMTAVAASTQTAALFTSTMLPPATPLPTLVPTNIPTSTPSATPTFLFILATLSPTSTPVTPTVNYDCALTAQTPSNGSVVSRNGSFQVNWTVRNTGIQLWDSNTVDFIYSSGNKLSKLKAADLPSTVVTGDTVTLTLTMTAPYPTGTYKTSWTLRAGKVSFCKLTVSVVVK